MRHATTTRCWASRVTPTACSSGRRIGASPRSSIRTCRTTPTLRSVSGSLRRRTRCFPTRTHGGATTVSGRPRRGVVRRSLRGARHGCPRAGERGEDVRVEASVDFVEAVRGTTRGVTFHAIAGCGACRVTGAAPGGRRTACPACRGSGRVREVGDADRGRLIRFRECERCRGAGSLVDRPCAACKGEGRVGEERTILLTIPAGSVGRRRDTPGRGGARRRARRRRPATSWSHCSSGSHRTRRSCVTSRRPAQAARWC